MTKVVTFYSYKGGVGRTMALVNAAHAMAKEGLRVLMIDLDLEAPGMTHFFAKAVRGHAAEGRRHDALDLLLHVKGLCERAAIHERTFEPVSLVDYAIPIALPRAWIKEAGKTSPYLVGRLDLLPATLDPATIGGPSRDYLERLAELDLPGIFSQGGPGHSFGREVRCYLDNARFDAPGDIVYTLRETVKAAYDIILVDSRTGLNEISGLCIGPLCDALVVCTGLNEQNVEGTRYFMQQAGLLDRTRAKPYTVVAGPVPPWTRVQTDARLKRIRDALQVETLGASVPYHPSAALGEPVFVVDDPEEAIAKAYRELASGIIHLTPVRDPLPKAPAEPKAVAAMLATVRIRRYSAAVALPSLPIFPSYAAVNSIFTQRGWSWEQAGPEFVAVAAYHLRSPEPFVRAISRGKERGDDVAAKLVLLRLRLAERIPIEAKGADRWLVTELKGQSVGRSDRQGLARAYARALGVIHEGLTPPASHSESRQLRRFVSISMMDEGQVDMAFPKFEAVWDYILEPKLPAAVKRDALPSFKDTEETLSLFESDKRDFYRSRDYAHYSSPRYAPVFGPIPVMISLVCLVKGRAAAEELIRWLALCRRVHGYAWRVLVDWRHLAEFGDEPRFVNFVKEEDDLVTDIERAIDRGEYSL